MLNGPAMPAAKRNLGAKEARGKYLAFFDDDVEINPDCLSVYLNSFVNHTDGMFYGKLWNMEFRDRFDEAGGFLTWTGFIWSRAQQNDYDNGQFDKIEPILAGKSASCIILKSIFDKVGGFDEDFGILGEETDLSWRVWHLGYNVLFQPMATGWHAFNTKFKPPQDYYTSARVQYNGCRNYITMLIKNLEWRNLCLILPLHISVWVLAGLLMVVTGKFTQGINIFRGLLYVPLNLGLILRKRRKVQSERIKRDSEILPIITARPSRAYYTQRFSRYLKIGLHG